VFGVIDSYPGYMFQRADTLIEAWQAKQTSPDTTNILDNILVAVFYNGFSGFEVDHVCLSMDKINADGEVDEAGNMLEFCIEIATRAERKHTDLLEVAQQQLSEPDNCIVSMHAFATQLFRDEPFTVHFGKTRQTYPCQTDKDKFMEVWFDTSTAPTMRFTVRFVLLPQIDSNVCAGS
jgi:hypothetical protein